MSAHSRNPLQTSHAEYQRRSVRATQSRLLSRNPWVSAAAVETGSRQESSSSSGGAGSLHWSAHPLRDVLPHTHSHPPSSHHAFHQTHFPSRNPPSLLPHPSREIHPHIVPQIARPPSSSVSMGSHPQRNPTPSHLKGDCAACDKACYYILKVSFGASLLVGIFLIIVGLILHHTKGENLVLTYIGGLTALVAGLLLTVQRHNRQHGRSVSSRSARHTMQTSDPTAIPLRELHTQYECVHNPQSVAIQQPLPFPRESLHYPMPWRERECPSCTHIQESQA